MTEYWKSQDKKFCDICKCWIADNVLSIQVHENGVRHKMNSQEKLRDIQKKAKSKDKDEKKLAKSLRQIEEAAAAASALDKESNPDMSLKIQSYMDYIKEKEATLAGTVSSTPINTSQDTKILHRDEKDANALFEIPTPKPYLSRLGGGWTSVNDPGPKVDLELPSSSYSVSSGKSKKKKTSKSSTTAPIPSISINYTAKFKEKPKHIFSEKTIPSTSTSGHSTTTSTAIKPDPHDLSEVAFKKRKFNRPNARRPIDD